MHYKNTEHVCNAISKVVIIWRKFMYIYRTHAYSHRGWNTGIASVGTHQLPPQFMIYRNAEFYNSNMHTPT